MEELKNGQDEQVRDLHDARAAKIGDGLRLRPPEFPAALGIIRSVRRQTFDDGVLSQLEYEKENAKFRTVDELLKSGETWEIKS